MALTRQKKEEFVARIAADLKKYPVIGVASIEGLPAKQYSTIKKKVNDHVKVDSTRLTLMTRAVEASGRPELKDLEKYFGNATVLVCTDLDAFKLYSLFKKNKSKTLIKPGQIAPHDIIVPAGETNLPPGPALTDLKNAKISAKIQGPKIHIVKDAIVAKAGEEVSDVVASVLAKLGIEPMEVGLNVKAVWDNGTLYEGDVLNVDEEAFAEDLAKAHQQAVNLCVYAEIYNEASAPLIIMKAAREANALKNVLDEATGKETPAVEAKPEAAPEAEAPAVESVTRADLRVRSSRSPQELQSEHGLLDSETPVVKEPEAESDSLKGKEEGEAK